jgi:hypothetical protein
LSYHATVEQFFLSLKGSGLALSASDYQLIGEWESQNIPVKLICRAIENGYYCFEEQSSRQIKNISLIKIQKYIEEEVQKETYK